MNCIINVMNHPEVYSLLRQGYNKINNEMAA